MTKRQPTPFRALILFLQLTNAVYALSTIVLFSLVIRALNWGDYGWGVVNLLPIGSGILLLSWNLSSFTLMFLRNPAPYHLLVWLDSLILFLATASGIAGAFYDVLNYTEAVYGYVYGYGSSASGSEMLILVVGVVMLGFGLATQAFLLLFTILESRYTKRTDKNSHMNAYGGYPGAVISRDGFGSASDWKSGLEVGEHVDVEGTTEGTRSQSQSLVYEASETSDAVVVQRPTPVVEPKSRFNPLIHRSSEEV